MKRLADETKEHEVRRREYVARTDADAVQKYDKLEEEWKLCKREICMSSSGS